MAKKPETVTAGEFADFMTNGWPGEDWYMEDTDDDLHSELFNVTDDGWKAKDPGRLVVLARLDGILCWQGSGDPGPLDGASLVSVFKKWRKAKTTAVVVVEVPNDQVEVFKAMLVSIKGKVVR